MSERAAVRRLAVWCPDWPVTAAILAGAVSADTSIPVALFAANRVLACSAAARAMGIRRDLRRREAQSRCPELVVVGHDPDRDARFFEPVVVAVESSAPGVEVVRPGLAAVAARGPSRYYGGDAATARQLAGGIACAAGISARVGVADGLLAATLAAQHPGSSHPVDEPVVVPAGGSAAFLAGQPVGALNRPDLADLLRRLGIRTLGDFAALPAYDVAGRFGADGADARRLARGLDIQPIAAREPSPDLIARTVFDPPVLRVDAAAFAAKALAADFHDRLTGRGLGCLRLGIVAHTSRGEELTRLWRHEGALSAKAVADRVRWQLDGWLTAAARAGTPPGQETGHRGDTGLDESIDSTDGIADLALVPDQLVPYAGAQLSLWTATSGGAAIGPMTGWHTDEEADERADRALTRVQGLLGPDAVLTAVPDGGRGPGEAVSLVPWGDPRVPARIPPRTAADRPGATPHWAGRIPAPSPATVFTRPELATITDAHGRTVGVTSRATVTAPPAYLDGQQIVAWTGPWPIDERWWDPAAARRRARFQVVTADGFARLLAVEGGRWWIEAVYD